MRISGGKNMLIDDDVVGSKPEVVGCRKSAQISNKNEDFRAPYRDGYCQSKRTIRDKKISQRNRERKNAQEAQVKKLVDEHEQAIIDGREM